MERKNSGIDALADWLRNVINEKGLPVPTPFLRSLPPEMLVYGICGLWRGTAPYRILEFLNVPMTHACFVCNDVIRGEYSCDFWLGTGGGIKGRITLGLFAVLAGMTRTHTKIASLYMPKAFFCPSLTIFAHAGNMTTGLSQK
jgi:hypothetical protein